MEVFWSDRANWEFAQNIDFLEEEWGFKSAADFNEKIEYIKSKPTRLQFHDRKRNIQKCHVVRQVTIYYTYDGRDIYLLSVFNNWQSTKRLDF